MEAPTEIAVVVEVESVVDRFLGMERRFWVGAAGSQGGNFLESDHFALGQKDAAEALDPVAFLAPVGFAEKVADALALAGRAAFDLVSLGTVEEHQLDH